MPPGVGRALSPPLIGHGGRIVACSGKNLLAFEPNGSIAWIVPLGYNCKQDVAPITEREKVVLFKLCQIFYSLRPKIQTLSLFTALLNFFGGDFNNSGV